MTGTAAPTLSAYLKTLRLRKQLSQKEAARRLGIAREYLSRLENGNVGLGAVMAQRISDVYEEPIEQVIAYVQTPQSKNDLLAQIEALAVVVDGLQERIDALEAQQPAPGVRPAGRTRGR